MEAGRGQGRGQTREVTGEDEGGWAEKGDGQRRGRRREEERRVGRGGERSQGRDGGRVYLDISVHFSHIV